MRILHDGEARSGRLEGTEVTLDSGERLDFETVTWLAPTVPTKIVAVSLAYRSRIAEYGGDLPAQPRYFLEPPSSLNGHRGELPRPLGTQLLNYEGELAVVSVADQGPGMAATADGPADGDSHRMGLAFVRAIMRRHGGKLDINTGPEGSIVTMRV